MERKIKKIRKINYQKIFCFASFIFILVCILWYGGRFIYFYNDSKKTITEQTTVFANELKNNNTENLKQVESNYYFYGDTTNNYVSYSNLLWRIVKINKDNTILLVTDSIIGTLSYGDSETSYEDSNLINWLNNEDNGKFIKILNEKEKYLKLTTTCVDTVDDIENITCKTKDNNYYLGLLSVEDYLYTGGNKGFINNQKYSYLANKNVDNDIWYITNEGKLDTTDGEDIMGIKTTITLSSTVKLKNGAGTKEDPYKIEDSNGLIGSYVKLDEDIWRIYEEKDGIIKLILQDTIKEDNQNFKYNYSKNNYYHNDTIYGSLAYYLNNTFYKNLNYKNLIIENTYVNGIYDSDNKYEDQNISSKTIETKVSIPSIDDIILNDNLAEHFTNTGVYGNLESVYIHKDNGLTTTRNVKTESYVVPCISILRENLTIGSGTGADPYRTEQ